MMNTEEGKRLAKKRSEYLKSFLEEFLEEWEGKR
jgi:HD superfamily phosphodiesterase